MPWFIRSHTGQALLRVWVACGEREEEAWELIRRWMPEGPALAPGTLHVRVVVPVQQIAARLALTAGDLPTAREWLAANDRWLAWSGGVRWQAENETLWAQYHRQAGDRGKANECAASALARATEPRQPLALLAAHRILGELGTDAGRFADAEEHLQTSLALADACAAPYERVLTLLALATLRIAMNRQATAASLLEEVRAICTPLGARPALARADALAAMLAAEPVPVPQSPAGLSARELEVLRLVAAGLTNAQVAERLFLSPHTINSHLTAIYNKLGVSGRNAATTFAYEHGLVGR
jgi:DNA-binding CsgD family transcriptional regulator